MTGLYLTAIFLGAATLAILVTLYLNREDPFTRSLAIGMVFCLIAITTATFYFKDYVPGAESSGVKSKSSAAGPKSGNAQSAPKKNKKSGTAAKKQSDSGEVSKV